MDEEKKQKILVVDDDQGLADLIAEFCRGAGFEAETVTDSLKAVDFASEWKPNLITLDLEMPGMDGIEVLRQLQACPETKQIPVIVVSVVARGAMEKGLLEGARLVFEKPLKFQKLIHKLQQLLSGAGSKESSDKKENFDPKGSLS